MKKLILISALLFSFNGWTEDSMIPLRDFMQKNKEYISNNDPKINSYWLNRCTAINLNMMAVILKYPDSFSSMKEQLPDFYERKRMEADYFTRQAVNVRQTVVPEDTDTEHLNNVTDSMEEIAELYNEVIGTNYLKTGGHFTDWMLEDLSYCSNVYDVNNK